MFTISPTLRILMNRTEQIFYFRTYTKYVVKILYIYTFVPFGICYTAIIRMLVLETIIVYVYFLKKTTKHTQHTRTHTTHTRTHTLRILILNLTHSWEIVGGGTRIVCPLLCMALVKQATALRI